MRVEGNFDSKKKLVDWVQEYNRRAQVSPSDEPAQELVNSLLSLKGKPLLNPTATQVHGVETPSGDRYYVSPLADDMGAFAIIAIRAKDVPTFVERVEEFEAHDNYDEEKVASFNALMSISIDPGLPGRSVLRHDVEMTEEGLQVSATLLDKHAGHAMHLDAKKSLAPGVLTMNPDWMVRKLEAMRDGAKPTTKRAL
jgi:hypothetical protein